MQHRHLAPHAAETFFFYKWQIWKDFNAQPQDPAQVFVVYEFFENHMEKKLCSQNDDILPKSKGNASYESAGKRPHKQNIIILRAPYSFQKIRRP